MKKKIKKCKEEKKRALKNCCFAVAATDSRTKALFEHQLNPDASV